MASYLFDTAAEADAFLEGVVCANSPDISTLGPIASQDGRWTIVVSDADEEDE